MNQITKENTDSIETFLEWWDNEAKNNKLVIVKNSVRLYNVLRGMSLRRYATVSIGSITKDEFMLQRNVGLKSWNELCQLLILFNNR